MAPIDSQPGGTPRPESALTGGGAQCPNSEAWRHVEATGGHILARDFATHLRDCPACTRRYEALTAAWSRTDLLSPAADAAGHDTRALIERLAATAPPREPGAPPPAIDGLTGLVEVGRGGMGIVYRARDSKLERTVAVKLLTSSAATPEGRMRAEREARILARIAHPNIVRIHSVVEVEGSPAIVMEWIDGPSLVERGRQGRLPLREVVTVVHDLARAVDSVHAAGIIHRDIKPANVLLARPAGDGRAVPKLIDFGLARPDSNDAAALTRQSVVIGTPSFMAPEQTGLDPTLGAIGPAADIHALGALLYWLLSGKPPYDGSTTAAVLITASQGNAPPLSALIPHVPVDVGTIVGHCLERRPDRRYGSAAALADDLDRFLAGRPILARRPRWPERVARGARRRPVVAAFVFCSALAALAIAFGTAFHVRSVDVAREALAVKQDEAIAAAVLARASFARLTDATAERLLARGSALDEDDRDHLRQIRNGYSEWPLEPDKAAALHLRAAGLFRLTGLFNRLHWPDDALATAQACLPNMVELDRRGILTPEEVSDYHTLERILQALLANAGRLNEAIAVARAAIDRLSPRVGPTPALERHLAVAWGDLGNLAAVAGESEESRRCHERALDAFDHLLDAAPDDAELTRLSLTVLWNAAISPALGSDTASRRRLFGRLVERSSAALAHFERDRVEIGRGLLLGLSGLTKLDLAEGRPTEALALARRRAEVARRLADETDARQNFLGEAIIAACQAARCLEALGRPGEGVADLDAADALATAAIAEEPAMIARTRTLLEVLQAKASIAVALDRDAEAIAAYERLLDALEPWTEGEGRSAEFVAKIAEVQGEIGRLRSRLESRPAAASPAAGSGR
jgi:tetratricopeptide (TPR) repeat protein